MGGWGEPKTSPPPANPTTGQMISLARTLTEVGVPQRDPDGFEIPFYDRVALVCVELAKTRAMLVSLRHDVIGTTSAARQLLSVLELSAAT